MAFADFPRKPNLLILITDQQSGAPHWPKGWAEANLPAMDRLKRHGLAFTRAYTNSCTCSPARVTLFTGLYPSQHGVTQVLEFDGSKATTERLQVMLSSQLQNLAKILKTAGYNVVYKGKWHLTKPARYSEDLGYNYWSEADVAHIAERWGFDGWNQPDAGDNLEIGNMGGGVTNNDGRFVDGHGKAGKHGDVPYEILERESVVHFLTTYDSDRPFCLIVSLVNPHDVLAYPGTGPAKVDGQPLYQAGGYNLEDFEDLKIERPETVNEDLSTKPAVQAAFRKTSNLGNGRIGEKQVKRQLDYVRFYAYLCRLIDGEIVKVLDALDASGRADDTLILRISDHGDMAMAHGRQRQKMYNVYEETVNVPMVFSNRRLFPKPQTTDSLAGLIDVLPTFATIAGVRERDRWTFKGKDLTPILERPAAEVQDFVHFTFEDLYFYESGANHIRCLIEKEWKYAVYYDVLSGVPAQYEMYHRATDPLETVNLGHPDHYGPEVAAERERLHLKLTAAMDELGTTPPEIIWPKVSEFDPEASYSGRVDTGDEGDGDDDEEDD